MFIIIFYYYFPFSQHQLPSCSLFRSTSSCVCMQNGARKAENRSKCDRGSYGGFPYTTRAQHK